MLRVSCAFVPETAMRRREFISFIGSVAATWPLAARAQKQPARIGFLGSGAADTSAIFVEALKLGLDENGLQEGRDYVFDLGWADGNYDRFPALAEKMVQNNATVILATTISAVRSAQRASNTIPIVMTSINDPVGAGLIKSLSRPGGNTTGLANLAEDVSEKMLELTLATLPNATKIAALLNPANPANPVFFAKIVKLAGVGIGVYSVETRSSEQLDSAFAALGRDRPDALLVLPDSTLIDAREKIAALALRYRIPTITNAPEYTDAGALISYGVSRLARYRRCAYYVKRILDGANPADLPVEQPTKIELSINLKTAKKLAIPIPDTLVARADRLIE